MFTPEQKEEVLVAYALCGKSARATSKHCKEKLGINVSEDQISRWSKGLYINAESAKNADTLKQSLADRAEVIAGQILEAIPGAIALSSINQLSVSFGIMVDKMQLLRGDATSITGHTMSNQELADKINAIAPELVDPKLRIVGE